MKILKFIAGRGLAQVGIKVSKDNDWNEQQAAETGQGIMRMRAGNGEILKEKKRFLSRQTLELDFFQPSSGTHASPPVYLDTGDVDPVRKPPTVQGEVPST